MDPSVRKAAVGESYIGETCCCDLEVGVVCHHEILHDTLAGAHDVDRICCLVGRDAEEVLWWIDGQEVHELLGLDIIVLNECLNAVLVLLGTDVLVSREVGNDVETLLLAENALEDRVSKVKGVATEPVRHEESFGRTNVTNEFCKPGSR